LDEGVCGAVLRAFDQALPNATDRRAKRRGVMWWVPPVGRKCGEKHQGAAGYKTLHEEERKGKWQPGN
jgi:hypothetical protein